MDFRNDLLDILSKAGNGYIMKTHIYKFLCTAQHQRWTQTELGYYLELIVLGAIAIELFALYNHNKTSNRIDDHMLDTDRRLEKSDTMMKVMDDHIYRINEHIIRLDEHMNRVESHMSILDEHLIRNHEGLSRLDGQIRVLDRIAD